MRTVDKASPGAALEVTPSPSVNRPAAAIMPAGPPYSYLGVAQGLLASIRVLASATPMPGLTLAIVCAQALKRALKAFLSRDGKNARLRPAAIRHNIEEL
jgi:hypothetical protein